MNDVNRFRWWLLVFVWCGAIYYFTESPLFTGEQTARWLQEMFQFFGIETSYPIEDGAFSWNFIIRKCAHMIVFGTFAFLVWQATRSYRFAWILTFFYAAFDEWHQSFQPGRTALFSDVIIDMVGATIVLWLISKKRKRA